MESSEVTKYKYLGIHNLINEICVFLLSHDDKLSCSLMQYAKGFKNIFKTLFCFISKYFYFILSFNL